MSNKAHIRRLLKEANLMEYHEPFIAYGADCVVQIAELPKYEFQELLTAVGMAQKPLHVRRLLKALENITGQAPDYDTVIQEPSQIVFAGQPDFKTTISDQLSTVPKKRGKSQFYGEVALPCDSIFEKLLPKRTEDEHNELIKTKSMIYSKSDLNKYQQYINAIAEQFCRRDPMLLVSKKQLFDISKEAVRQSDYKFRRGHSVSQHAKACEINTNFKLANRNREQRLRKIEELESSIERDNTERDVLISKVKDLSRDQKSVGIGIVKTQLDIIEENIFVKRRKLKTLNDSQKRSERYYIAKILPMQSPSDPEAIVAEPIEKKATTIESPKSPPRPPIQINSKNYNTDHSKSERTIHITNALRPEQYNPNSDVEIVMNEADFAPIAGSLDVLTYNTSDQDENTSNEESYNSGAYGPELSTVMEINTLVHDATACINTLPSTADDTDTVDTSSLLHSVFTSTISQDVNNIYKMKEDDIIVDGEFSSIAEENGVMNSFMDVT